MPYETLGVTARPVPTPVCEYVNVGVPVMDIESPDMTPLSTGLPIAVAVFVLSYVLLNVGGVMVRDC